MRAAPFDVALAEKSIAPFPLAAYCDHPVRFGVVESINTTIKAVLRRAREMKRCSY
jgi:hypothetical protein